MTSTAIISPVLSSGKARFGSANKGASHAGIILKAGRLVNAMSVLVCYLV
ncbi:hypothetical protein [Moraxella lacunata]